ncbi:MAG: hypothetical protein M3O22_09245 [Pseudomonadota bacterium]|nr:hypothetical protein [Pseudomonadota bacterium]
MNLAEIPAITIHSLEECRAAVLQARKAGQDSVVLLSAPMAGAHGGALWFSAMIRLVREEFPDMAVTGILDCGNHPGLALQALEADGVEVLVSPDTPGLSALQDIAAARGKRLRVENRTESR